MKNISLLFLFFGSFIYSQKSHIFFYELKFKNDSLAENYRKDYYVLDVTQKENKFYNYEYYKNDSISKAKINSEPIFSYNELDIRLIHKKNNEFYNYHSQTPLYYLLKSNDEQKWEILSEKKKYANFDVQKATTKFGGRTWTAWFTSDIPLNYGPYKFYGLPGLILEISDDKENYIFAFRGNKNVQEIIDTSNFLETENGLKSIEINQNQWNKLRIDYYKNPLKDFGEGGLIIENDRGEKVQVNSKEVIKNQQNFLRKNNNPIELDKSIQYPEN